MGDLGAARLGDDLERELVRARLDALVDEHEQRQRAHEVQLECLQNAPGWCRTGSVTSRRGKRTGSAPHRLRRDRKHNHVARAEKRDVRQLRPDCNEVLRKDMLCPRPRRQISSRPHPSGEDGEPRAPVRYFGLRCSSLKDRTTSGERQWMKTECEMSARWSARQLRCAGLAERGPAPPTRVM